MGIPPDSETFDGAGGEDDDVNPGNVPAPNTSLLLTNYRSAQLRVINVPAALDVTDDAPFFRNLPDVVAFDRGNAVRDVASTQDFWAIQLFGAYDPPEALDADGDDVDFRLGRAIGAGDEPPRQGPGIVYMETVRDVAATVEGLTEGELQRRVAFHESVHRFGLLHERPNGDDGPLNVDHNLAVGEDAPFLQVLTTAQLRHIQSVDRPL